MSRSEIRAQEGKNRIFPQRYSLINDFKFSKNHFLPKIRQTLEANAKKIINRNSVTDLEPSRSKTMMQNASSNLETLRERNRYFFKDRENSDDKSKSFLQQKGDIDTQHLQFDFAPLPPIVAMHPGKLKHKEIQFKDIKMTAKDNEEGKTKQDELIDRRKTSFTES